MDAVEIKESRADVALLVATLICIASSSSIAHEYASRFLDMTVAFGAVFNIRAFSCAAHAIGLAVGFGAAAFLGQANISRLRGMRALTAFFLSQIGLSAVFYAAFALHAELAIVALQIPIAALSALFIATMLHYAAPLPKGAVLVCIPLCIGIPAFIVHGVFGALETAPLAAAIIAHVGLLCVGLVCGSRFFRHQTANAPLKAKSAAYSAQLDVENSNSSQHSPIRPWLLVWIVVFTYGAVFGFYHVIPLALPTPASFGVTAPIIRISSNLLGAGLAAALLISSFSPGPLDTSMIWNRFYRLVFPLAVLAGLLIPFTQAQGYLLSIACSETALYYFDMIIALGCIAICKTLHADATSVFAHAFFARSSGFIAGNITGDIAHETCPLSNELISCVGIIAFTLLFLVTFNTNSEKYAKTVWGILPKENPKSRFDRKLHERCLQLAKEFQLTEREAQTLELLAQNKRPKEISNDLVLSVATIRTYVQGIYTKLDVHSHDELLKEIEKE